jgi:hypothetical protein
VRSEYSAQQERPSAATRQEEKPEQIYVKHLIDIQGVRFLYTKKILELIHHHLVKGFDYKQFRKTNFIDLDGEFESRNIFLDYEHTMAGRRKNTANQTPSNKMLNLKALKKEALVALRLEQAQVNFQNNLTES